MKTSLMQRLNIAMLSLLGAWAALCFVVPPIESRIYVAMAVGPLVSYAIGAWLIATLRREIAPL